MKKMFLIMIGYGLGWTACGQTQELEQLKLNLAKLAQLRLQLTQAKQGYQMLMINYEQLRTVSKGNFDLHQAQLDALWQVSTLVKQSPAVQLFKRQVSSLDSMVYHWMNSVNSSGVFTYQEQLQLQKKLDRHRKEMHALLERQQLLLTPHVLQLREAERFSLLHEVAMQGYACREKVQQEIQAQQLFWTKRKQMARDRKIMQQLYRN